MHRKEREAPLNTKTYYPRSYGDVSAPHLDLDHYPAAGDRPYLSLIDHLFYAADLFRHLYHAHFAAYLESSQDRVHSLRCLAAVSPSQ